MKKTYVLTEGACVGGKFKCPWYKTEGYSGTEKCSWTTPDIFIPLSQRLENCPFKGTITVTVESEDTLDK